MSITITHLNDFKPERNLDELIINHSINSNDGAYAAKIIWESLYRLSYAHEFVRFYEFLCDLRWFEKMIEQGNYILLWQFENNKTYTITRTGVTLYEIEQEEPYYRIEFFPKQHIKITLVKPKVHND